MADMTGVEPKSPIKLHVYKILACLTGLEPTACFLGGKTSFLLNYRLGVIWRTRREWNPQPLVLESSALPIELRMQNGARSLESN